MNSLIRNCKAFMLQGRIFRLLDCIYSRSFYDYVEATGDVDVLDSRNPVVMHSHSSLFCRIPVSLKLKLDNLPTTVRFF